MKVYQSINCPNCNAPLPTVGIHQNYAVCEYCGSRIELEVTEAEAQMHETRLKEEMFHASQEEKQYIRELNAKKRMAAGGLIILCFLSYFIGNYLDISFFQYLCMFLVIPCLVVASSAFRSENVQQYTEYESPKSRWAAFAICLLFGMFGGHCFYVGRYVKGVIYVFTFGLFGFGWMIDMIIIATGKYRDSRGRFLTR